MAGVVMGVLPGVAGWNIIVRFPEKRGNAVVRS
jgi:hypothetical protein